MSLEITTIAEQRSGKSMNRLSNTILIVLVLVAVVALVILKLTRDKCKGKGYNTQRL